MMHLIDDVQYYTKHKEDIAKVISMIAALIPKGPSDPVLTNDIVALINKHWPHWNPNHLIEDTLALIKLETAPDAAPPTERGGLGA